MRSHARALLLLGLLLTLLLEAIYVIQPTLFVAVHREYPTVAMDREGRVLYYDTRRERREDGTIGFVEVLDTGRTSSDIEHVRNVILESRRGFRGGPDVFDNPRFLAAYRTPYWRPAPESPLERLAKRQLQPMEAARRELVPTADGTEGTRVFRLAPDHYPGRRFRMPIQWRVEEDRLVCRETATGRVLAALGPDGYATGESAAAGERFGRIDAGPIPVREGSPEWFLLDVDGRRLYRISPAVEQARMRDLPADSLDVVPITVEMRPLRPLGETAGPEATPFAWQTPSHVLVFLADGSVLAEVDLEPNETVLGVSGASLIWPHEGVSFESRRPALEVGLETRFHPVSPGDERRRLRLLRPGQPAVVRDVVLTPTRAGEVFLANLTASLALLRPPPLAVASSLSPLPTSKRWWWRDAWLAGGSYPGWLIASLALAAFLAWRARRAARERCATVGHVRFWTIAVLLLGPVGFLWMKLVLPRVPVEPVGGARRAVDLDAAPSTAAPWPEPKPHGIEIFS